MRRGICQLWAPSASVSRRRICRWCRRWRWTSGCARDWRSMTPAAAWARGAGFTTASSPRPGRMPRASASAIPSSGWPKRSRKPPALQVRPLSTAGADREGWPSWSALQVGPLCKVVRSARWSALQGGLLSPRAVAQGGRMVRPGAGGFRLTPLTSCIGSCASAPRRWARHLLPQNLTKVTRGSGGTAGRIVRLAVDQTHAMRAARAARWAVSSAGSCAPTEVKNSSWPAISACHSALSRAITALNDASVKPSMPAELNSA